MDEKELLNYAVIAIALYVVFQWTSTRSEGMLNLGPNWKTPTYAYPATYPAYYKLWQLDVMNDADKCLPLNVNTQCMNKQLYETGGDLHTGMSKCNGIVPNDQYLHEPQYRKLLTGWKETTRIMPLTVPATNQEVPTYESWAHRRY